MYLMINIYACSKVSYSLISIALLHKNKIEENVITHRERLTLATNVMKLTNMICCVNITKLGKRLRVLRFGISKY